MTDLTSLWHAAAPPPPPPPATTSKDSTSQDSIYNSRRSPSPLKKVLRSISPAPNLPRTRSQSLQFDAYSKGDELPADTFSPEPPVRQRTPQPPTQERSRTMSYTPGDHYSPIRSPHTQAHAHAHTMMPSSSSSSLHGQWIQQAHAQPPLQQQGNYTYQQQVHQHPQMQYSHPPAATSPNGFVHDQRAYTSPTPYDQRSHASPTPYDQRTHASPTPYDQHTYASPTPYDPRTQASPTPYDQHAHTHASAHAHAYSQPASPTHYTSTPPVSRSAYYNTVTTSPGPSRSPLPRPAPPTPAQHPHGVSVDSAPQRPPSAFEAWRNAQLQQQQPQSQAAPVPQPPLPASSVPFPNGTNGILRSPAGGGTIRRALPRPPGAGPAAPPAAVPAQPASAAVPAPAPEPAPSRHRASPSTASTSSTISRTDSVRMAAEELMSRGVPRRGGARGFSRFNHASRSSPLGPATSSSTDSVQDATSPATSDSHVRSSQSEPTDVGASREVHEDLARRFEQSTTIAEEAVEEPSVAALSEPIESALPPRPSSRGPRDDVMEQSTRRPATFASAQAEARRESNSQATSQQPQPTALSPATEVPKIFSPPPNAAPPVPSIVFDGEQERGSAGPAISISGPDSGSNAPVISVSGPDHSSSGPSINVSGPEAADGGPSINISGPDDTFNGPSISVSGPEDAGPSISVSSPDDNDGTGISGITPSVSLSHTADHVPATPQRASATTSQSLAQAGVNGHAHAAHPGHHHSHPHQHPHSQSPHPAPQSASSVAGAICGGCQKYIAGRVVQAIGQCFHPDCFSCNHCGELLEHVAFYEHQGKAYCHFDYHELFSLRCFHCRTPIVDERFIQISDPDLVAGVNGKGDESSANPVPVRYYHDLHFFCANCGDPFMDPKRATSTAGSQRGQIQVDDQGRVISGSKAFVVWKGYPYCEGCHHNLHKSRCKSCHKPILHDVITALKGKWHPECFVCTSCKQPYPDERVFVDSKGNGYDEECYKVWLRSQL